MTVEKAIQVLQNLKVCISAFGDVQALDVALDAMQKKIPRKPKENKRYNDGTHYLCPVCKNFVGFNGDILNYCDNCGQKLEELK